MKTKVGMVSLGCPKNLVDSEIMLSILDKNDFEITNDKSDADVLIVNTCGFIESAKQESINTILEMAECKKGKCKLLIAAGCLAERYKDEIRKELPEVDVVIGTGNVDEIAKVIKSSLKGEKTVSRSNLDALDYLENNRIVSTGKGYAYLKIAEGCDNHCTYCIIPALRGHYRSRSMENIIREARELVSKGARELILIAQDTTKYGTDKYGKKMLPQLLRELGEIEDLKWIRILYCYPNEIDQELIDEVARNPKVLKYFDIPMQHASDRILKTMGRKETGEELLKLVVKIRKEVPESVIRTTFIVGFPGEEEADFNELHSFIQKVKFDRLGVFTYSKEEDTPAAKLKNQVPKKLKEKRYNELMKVQQDISIEKNKERLGKVYETLVEGIAEDGIFYFGRTYAEAPDIDGSIYFTSSQPLEIGTFVKVKILNTEDYDLIGDASYESAQ